LCNFDDVIEDGAPTGSEDPEYARGFRYGQEYGIEVGINAGILAERLRVIKLLQSASAKQGWDLEEQLQIIIDELKDGK
jgi:hypothetical protein